MPSLHIIGAEDHIRARSCTLRALWQRGGSSCETYEGAFGHAIPMGFRFGRKGRAAVEAFDLRLEKARMVENGGTLEITGKVKKSTPLSMIGFNLEEITTEGVTPRDPADVERAMALVPY
mgnify:CR=1 FL=1